MNIKVNEAAMRTTSSTHDQKWIEEFKEQCSCGRPNLVPVFYCQEEACQHKNQIFCNDCCLYDLKHIHKKKDKICDILQQRLTAWTEVNGIYNQLNYIIHTNKPSIMPIITFLDRENNLKTNYNIQSPTKQIAQDFVRFQTKFTNITQKIIEVERMYAEKQFTNILQTNRELESFKEYYEGVQYLLDLDSDHGKFLYNIYKPTLEIAGTQFRPFLDFTEKNKDMFICLKFKWQYEHLQKKQNPEEVKHNRAPQQEPMQQHALPNNIQNLIRDLQIKVDQVEQALRSKVENSTMNEKITHLMNTNSTLFGFQSLEQENRRDEYLQSVKDFVSLKLKPRLETLEAFKTTVDGFRLSEKMKMLTELNTYTRGPLKQEVKSERNGQFKLQMTTLETSLKNKINQKTSMEEVKSFYQPKIITIQNNLSQLAQAFNSQFTTLKS